MHHPNHLSVSHDLSNQPDENSDQTSNSFSFHQCLAVVRHGERADHDYEFFKSKDGIEHPYDPPLTSRGIEQGHQVGCHLRNMCQKRNLRFKVVISSPFRRCIQTATEICRVLGVPLLIDQELGEIFGQAVMGKSAPQLRKFKQVCEVVPKDVKILNSNNIAFYGVAPEWGESVEDARLRFVCRIDRYFDRSVRLRQNFVLVTHADAVASALAPLLLSREGYVKGEVVSRVDFCGYFLALRHVNCQHTKNSKSGSVVDDNEDHLSSCLLDASQKWEVLIGNVSIARTPLPQEDQKNAIIREEVQQAMALKPRKHRKKHGKSSNPQAGIDLYRTSIKTGVSKTLTRD